MQVSLAGLVATLYESLNNSDRDVRQQVSTTPPTFGGPHKTFNPLRIPPAGTFSALGMLFTHGKIHGVDTRWGRVYNGTAYSRFVKTAMGNFGVLSPHLQLWYTYGTRLIGFIRKKYFVHSHRQIAIDGLLQKLSFDSWYAFFPGA